jgi:fatty-acyl-CoA synthase
LKETERTKTNYLVIVGDAFAKPILGALDKAKDEGKPYNLETIKMMISSGVMWSAEVKEGLLAHHEMLLVDAMGSTE